MVGSCLPCPSCSVPWEGMDCSPLKERSLSVGTNLGGASFDLDQFLCSVLQQDTWEMFPCSVLVFCFWFFWRCLLPLEIFCCKVVEFMNLPYTWCMVKFLSSRDCNLLYCLSASLSRQHRTVTVRRHQILIFLFPGYVLQLKCCKWTYIPQHSLWIYSKSDILERMEHFF